MFLERKLVCLKQSRRITFVRSSNRMIQATARMSQKEEIAVVGGSEMAATATSPNDDATAKIQPQRSSSIWQAPPFPATDPTYMYPLSRFPPDAFWQRQVVVPALIVPARRTSELRNQLKHLLHQPGASKSKHHSPVQLLTEQDDVYLHESQTLSVVPDRSQYRKIVLRSIPRTTEETTPPNEATTDVENDAVYDDPAIQALLTEHANTTAAVADNDSTTSTTPLRRVCIKARHVVTRIYPHDYSVDELLRILLPTATELPGSSFEVVGTIAHVNLRDEFLPFQYWIGKVLYDKHVPRIQTIVTKVGTIETVYRTFDMQVIAPCRDEPIEGKEEDVNTNNTSIATTTQTVPCPQKDWNIVTVNEEGCTFQLDYQKVYWNSRLSGEHQRLVKWWLQENRKQQQGGGSPLVVADLMAGVGPFAVPLTTTNKTHSRSNTAKNKKTFSTQLQPVVVHANDLNPSCYHYLKINAQNNKCQQLHCYNMDGRRLVHVLQDKQIHVDHFIMNLPAMAPECCTAFQGYRTQDANGNTMPRLHVYCFAPKPPTEANATNTSTSATTATSSAILETAITTTASEYSSQEPHPYQSAVDRCSRALGCQLDWQRDDVSVHVVRDVSPNKNMVCVCFRLPPAIQDLPRVNLEEEGSIVQHVADEPLSNDTGDGVDTSASPDAKRPKLMP